jgi:hypothetical protein
VEWSVGAVRVAVKRIVRKAAGAARLESQRSRLLQGRLFVLAAGAKEVSCSGGVCARGASTAACLSKAAKQGCWMQPGLAAHHL